MNYLKMNCSKVLKMLLILVFIFSNQLYSNNLKFKVKDRIGQIDTSKIHRIDKFDTILKGSPYFMNSWFSNAFIYLNNSKIEADLVFNILTNQVLFFKGDINNTVLIKPDSFNLAGYEFIKIDPKIKPKNTNFFQKIYTTEKLQLLKQFYCEFYKKNETNKLGNLNLEETVYGYYLKFPRYYLLKGNTKIEIDNSFTKKINNNRLKIENYVKKNKLDLKNEKDIIKIITYYNTVI